jgi:hypothetical protein
MLKVIKDYVNKKKQIHVKQLEKNTKILKLVNEYIKNIKIDKFLTNKEKLFLAYNEYKEYPKCTVCGEYTYLKKNNSFSDTCSKKCRYKLVGQKMKNTKLKKYGKVNTCTKDHLIEHFGVENISQLPGIGEKISKTKLNFSVTKKESINNKRKQTNFNKYGFEHPIQRIEIKEKINQTNLLKYGVENHLQITEVRKKGQKVRSLDSFKRINENYYFKPMFSENDFLNRENDKVKFDFLCKKCENIYKSRYADGHITSLCPTCFPKNCGTSKLEKDVLHFVEGVVGYKITDVNVKLLVIPKHKRKTEIDIYLPEKNIGIEFNGVYYHQDLKTKHFDKFLSAKGLGIKLIQITDYDWINNNQIIKKRLRYILGTIKYSIGARKCVIKEIDTKIKNLFLNKYHLQGEDKSSIKLGAFYKNRLVGVMTFSKPRFNTNFAVELSRFCIISGFKFPGLANKLFSYYINNFNPASIISYSKNDYGYGMLYKSLGFTFSHYSNPNFLWIKHKQVLSRYQTQKHLLKNILRNFDDSKSAVCNMYDNGFMRYFDSGNSVWVWQK